MFFKKKKKAAVLFDRADWYPMIRASICNGEQVAGFKNRRDGRFQEVMLISDEADLKEFLTAYQVSREEIVKEY